jgi:3-oxoacyl-[acyl-carrier protein] reductase
MALRYILNFSGFLKTALSSSRYLPKLVKFIREKLADVFILYNTKKQQKLLCLSLFIKIILCFKHKSGFLQIKIKVMNAVITGATRGIGRAIAIKLAENGYNIAVCARDNTALEELAAALLYTGVKVFYQAADCTLKDDVYSFCEHTAAEFGSIEVLVNNAGTFIPGPFLDEDDSSFEEQQLLNVNAAYYFSKFFGKIMRLQESGSIFNICSVASKEIIENAGSYCVTKSALLSLNHVLRQELSRYNVKVTAILPGSTLTSSWEGTTIPPEQFVQPEDIATTLITILNLSSGVNVEEVVLKPLQFNS